MIAYTRILIVRGSVKLKFDDEVEKRVDDKDIQIFADKLTVNDFSSVL